MSTDTPSGLAIIGRRPFLNIVRPSYLSLLGMDNAVPTAIRLTTAWQLLTKALAINDDVNGAAASTSTQEYCLVTVRECSSSHIQSVASVDPRGAV